MLQAMEGSLTFHIQESKDANCSGKLHSKHPHLSPMLQISVDIANSPAVEKVDNTPNALEKISQSDWQWNDRH